VQRVDGILQFARPADWKIGDTADYKSALHSGGDLLDVGFGNLTLLKVDSSITLLH
jgi:hypothetical protein